MSTLKHLVTPYKLTNGELFHSQHTLAQDQDGLVLPNFLTLNSHLKYSKLLTILEGVPIRFMSPTYTAIKANPMIDHLIKTHV